MDKKRRAFALVCGAMFCIDAALAQTGPTAVERERICILQARQRGLTGQSFNAYLDKCARGGSNVPAPPPPQPPGSASPAAPAPKSPRARNCWRMAQELGLKGGAAMIYYDRCVLR